MKIYTYKSLNVWWSLRSLESVFTDVFPCRFQVLLVAFTPVLVYNKSLLIWNCSPPLMNYHLWQKDMTRQKHCPAAEVSGLNNEWTPAGSSTGLISPSGKKDAIWGEKKWCRTDIRHWLPGKWLKGSQQQVQEELMHFRRGKEENPVIYSNWKTPLNLLDVLLTAAFTSKRNRCREKLIQRDKIENPDQ